MQGNAGSVTVRHAVTWTGEQWECRCGYTSDSDGGAYKHFTDSSKTGSNTSITDIPWIEDGDIARD